MKKKVNPDRIPPDRLEDQWHSLLLSTFLKIQEAVQSSKSRGLDQKQIADRIGMDDAQLSRILKGDVNITLRTMHRIARAIDCRLDVELTDLLSLKKSNAPTWDMPNRSNFPTTTPLDYTILLNGDTSTGKSNLKADWVGLKPNPTAKILELTSER